MYKQPRSLRNLYASPIKDDEIGEASSRHGTAEKCIQ